MPHDFVKVFLFKEFIRNEFIIWIERFFKIMHDLIWNFEKCKI